jgi:hypothetical protein
MNLDRIALQFQRQMECAKQAGIWDNLCLGFGSVLAYIREGGPNVHDDDDDMIIFAENITEEQEQEYARLCGEATAEFPGNGIFEKRRLMEYRPDNGRLFWLSLKGDRDGVGRKCCHWFMWEHGGYIWHAKHKTAKVKGIPANMLQPGGPVVTYMGAEVHLPSMAGACLDWWYPGNWMVPAPSYGSSSPKALMKVGDWKNHKTWRIMA